MGHESASKPTSWTMAVAMLLLALAIFLPLAMLYRIIETYPLYANGITTTGKVVERGSGRDDRQYFYYITYEFSANGQVYTNKNKVAPSLYHKTYIGEPIKIRYVKGDPAQNILAGREKTIWVYLVVMIIAVGIPIGAYLIGRKTSILRHSDGYPDAT